MLKSNILLGLTGVYLI